MKTRKKNRRGTAKPAMLRKPPYSLKQERLHRYRALSFPEVAGKKTARVELVTSSEYHAVVVVFEDDTAVGFEFQPGFTVQAFGEAINGIGRNASRTWPEISNER